MDHFRFLAPFYDRFMGAPDVDRLTRLLALPTGGGLLDVGGGTGRVSALLQPRVTPTVVCDLSLPMLARARGKGLAAVCSRAERLPFPDAAFARVLAVDALHHFRDAAGATAEMARVLAPGGRLLIEEFDRARALVRWLALGETLVGMRSRFLRAQDIRELLEGQGLNVRICPGRRLATYVLACKGI
jgi:demethylmenaquinone methyltransferase/2-methoxy-6-polyprenyl-1,4-benzoquinol methylase